MSPYEEMLRQQMQPQGQQPPPAPQQQVQAKPMQMQFQQSKDDDRPKKDDGGGIMSMMSDRRSKEQISQLESANAALTKALSSKAEYPDTGASSSGMQALGQQAARPSHADFPDAPADKVAAQNVAMRQAVPQAQTPPTASIQSQGTPMPAQSGGSPFAFQRTMPNMDELDRAYARMGRGG